MSKLDWRKASLRESDPARAQQVRDFVEPDPVVIKIVELTPMEKRQQARGLARLKRWKAIHNAKRKPKSKPIEKQVSPEENRQAANARRLAYTEHHRRYLAKAESRRAAIASKKKTHLEAWVEDNEGLQTDRANLRRSWRSKLLVRSHSE